MDKKEIAIIGGGVSGFSSGIYALKNGYQATIYEKLPRIGGFCTTWIRDGFRIDGCVHWLTGTKENTNLYDEWKDVGVINDDKQIIFQDDCGSFEYEGITIVAYCDLNKFEKELTDLSPLDKKEIHKFIKYINKSVNVPLPLYTSSKIMNFFRLTYTGIKLLPYLPFYNWSSKISCEEYSLRFKHPAIRYLITHMQIGPGGLYSMLYSFGTIAFKNGGIPKNGSDGIISSMKKTYLDLGGKIVNNCVIKDILIKDKKITKLINEKGEEITADYYVSSIPPDVLLNKLLKGKYKDPTFDKKFAKTAKFPVPSAFICYFSCNRNEIRKALKTTSYRFNIKPIKVGNSYIDSINIHSYDYDDYYLKDDETVIQVMLDQYNDDFSYWYELSKNNKDYELTKNRIASTVSSLIKEHFPTLNVKLLDALSPYTFYRYLGTYNGAYMPFMLNNTSRPLFHKGKIKGIKNLYVSGQWTLTPGGLPMALISGLASIEHILKDEHKPYILSKPKFFKYSLKDS